MAHTPGPWAADTGGENEWHVNSASRGRWKAVALVTANHEGSAPVTEEEAEANANLIAAAPELLVACDRAETLLGELRRHLPGLRAVHCANVLEALRAAIAKAKGS